MTPPLYAELVSLREKLSLLLETRTRERFVSHRFYEFGNKFVRLLARALKRGASGRVHKLQTPVGPQTVLSSKIADFFKEYYAQLYQLPPTLTGHSPLQKSECISKYLEEALAPQLST